MDGVVRSALISLVVPLSLLSCTSSANDDASQPLAAPTAGPAGVTLELGATSDGCCRVFTMNPGREDITVICGLVALDPGGHLIYAGVIPPRLPGHLRSHGFVAPPGRHEQGMVELPIDLAVDSYTAPCRPAAWHGSAPI